MGLAGDGDGERERREGGKSGGSYDAGHTFFDFYVRICALKKSNW